MTEAVSTAIRARFLAGRSTKIALEVATKAMDSALGDIPGVHLVRDLADGGELLDLTVKADGEEALAEALELAGPHIALLSKSAHLMSLDISGPVPDHIKAGLAAFSPVYDGQSA